MSFKKSYNTLLNEVLTEYQNLTATKITQGSPLYIKAAASASMLWGLYQALDRAARQAFVTTADDEMLNIHAGEYGINTNGLTPDEIRDKLLEIKRNKMTGASAYDFEAWAREVEVLHEDTGEHEKVIKATVVPLARGEGTFDIVIEHSRFFEGRGKYPNNNFPSGAFMSELYRIIMTRRPVGVGFSWGMRIIPVSFATGNVNLDVTYSGEIDEAAAKSALADYIMSLGFDDGIVHAEVARILQNHGATFVRNISPADNFKTVSNKFEGLYRKFYVEPSQITLRKAD